MKESDFDGVDPIFILVFLKEIREACYCIGVYEGVGTWLSSYFLKKPSSLSLEAQLSPKKTHAAGLHVERSSSYDKVVY